MTNRTYKKISFSSLLLSLLVLVTLPSHAAQFKITRVYDGDTVKAVVGKDVQITIGLVGIDAPEASRKKREEGQPYSQTATRYLSRLILNKMVDIRGYGTDRYGRVLGVITVNNKNVNLQMVREGFAEAYRGKPPHGFDQSPYLKAEQEAREQKKGMWAQGEKYISPKDWRTSGKGNRLKGS